MGLILDILPAVVCQLSPPMNILLKGKTDKKNISK